MQDYNGYFNPTKNHNPNNPFGYKADQQEYIRADLVPRWEDIGTSDDKLIGAFLMTSLGAVNVGTICGDVVYLFGNDKPVRKNVFAYWMPIPKVPE